MGGRRRAIISMAQQARPKVAGHTLCVRAQFTSSSSVPVRKLWLEPFEAGVLQATEGPGLVRH